MESTLNTTLRIKRDDLLLILNVFLMSVYSLRLINIHRAGENPLFHDNRSA